MSPELPPVIQTAVSGRHCQLFIHKVDADLPDFVFWRRFYHIDIRLICSLLLLLFFFVLLSILSVPGDPRSIYAVGHVGRSEWIWLWDVASKPGKSKRKPWGTGVRVSPRSVHRVRVMLLVMLVSGLFLRSGLGVRFKVRVMVRWDFFGILPI